MAARTRTINKIYKFILLVKKRYTVESRASTATLCKSNRIATEYAKFMVQDGVLAKTCYNNRGYSSYIWKDPKGTSLESYAEKLTDRYNLLRNVQRSKRSLPRHNAVGNYGSIMGKLSTIEKQLRLINKKINTN